MPTEALHKKIEQDFIIDTILPIINLALTFCPLFMRLIDTILTMAFITVQHTISLYIGIQLPQTKSFCFG
jgi:hypothetical protein